MPAAPLTIALAQINPTVGDLDGNRGKIEKIWREQTDADLIVFPELSLCGYTPEDLVLKQSFLDAIDAQLKKLVAASVGRLPAILVGAPFRDEGKIYNAVHLISHGGIVATVRKHHLPNYDVFDEARIFTSAPLPGPVAFKGHRLGIMICEDMWYPDVAAHLAKNGAEILIVPNASPYDAGKYERRLMAARAAGAGARLPLLYVNQTGGQDEIVYDGASFALDAKGELIAQAVRFSEAILTTQWTKDDLGWRTTPAVKSCPPEPLAADYAALVTGLRDYVTKNGFTGVLLGLSGGIDSALTAAIAVDALGPQAVHGVLLPSIYTAADSITDATTLGANLGIALQTFSIADAVATFGETMSSFFAAQTPGTALDLTRQNIQARCRGLILMALSNAGGQLLLTTGNKSETAVGYSTLYGDMCGGFNPLKDVYKTRVYALSRWRNENLPPHASGPAGAVIPENSLTRAPTAELKPSQTDQDSLPPYEILDAILQSLLEGNLGLKEMAELGHDPQLVGHIARLIDRAEYKRRQAAPGPIITTRAFGRERRYPITNRFLA